MENHSEPTGLHLVNEVASKEGGPYKIPGSRAWLWRELVPEHPPIRGELPPEVEEEVSWPLLSTFICAGKRVTTTEAIAACIKSLEVIGKALFPDGKPSPKRGKKAA